MGNDEANMSVGGQRQITLRRVAITGLGAVTPLGIGTEEYWSSLLAGKSGVGPVTRFDCTDIGTKIAAEVKEFNAEDYVDRKEAKRMDRFVQLAIAATKMAMDNSGFVIDDSNHERVATVFGSGIGGIATFEEQNA